MPLYYKTIARDLGTLIHIPAALAVPTLFVATLAREWFMLPGLLAMVLLSLATGQLLYRFGRDAERTVSTLPLIVAALAWLLIPLLGMLPFYGAALLGSDLSPTTLAFRDPLNALFESMSGFTSTGLTVAMDASDLPMTLQWWRSLSQWVGAIGVVVLALAVIEPQESKYRLYAAEARTKDFADDVTSATRAIWKIYLFYTALTIVVYLALGMPWWEALNHGLTAISTGGFTVMPQSFQGYGAQIKLATIVIIIIGAINFRIHYLVLRQGDWSAAFQESQLRTFGFLLVTGTMLLMLVNFLVQPDTLLIDTIFQWTTALATCGFSTADLSTWSQPALLLLSAAMTVGGAAGSTTGGLKLIRLTWLVKAFAWQFHEIWWWQQKTEPQYTFNGERIDREEALNRIQHAAVLALLWVILLGLGSLALLLLPGHERGLSEVLFETVSALSTVGLSVGISEPTLHPAGRLVLILLMWMGRLEILAVLVLLSTPFGLRMKHSA